MLRTRGVRAAKTPLTYMYIHSISDYPSEIAWAEPGQRLTLANSVGVEELEYGRI
jgi:hypothetical protein